GWAGVAGVAWRRAGGRMPGRTAKAKAAKTRSAAAAAGRKTVMNAARWRFPRPPCTGEDWQYDGGGAVPVRAAGSARQEGGDLLARLAGRQHPVEVPVGAEQRPPLDRRPGGRELLDRLLHPRLVETAAGRG